MTMSWNESQVRLLRMIVIAGLLLALIGAMLGSIGVQGHHWSWTDSAGVPGTPPTPATGMTFRTTEPR
jgi:hypothetical protein